MVRLWRKYHGICCFSSIAQPSVREEFRQWSRRKPRRGLKMMMMMANAPLTEKRADQRFSFFADAEVTLWDGTSVPTQVAELSSRGCYIGTLLPIPVGTEIRLQISDGIRTCELQGRVVYLHSSSGLGIFGMGVQLEKMAARERSVIDGWLHDLAAKRTAAPLNSA
jgi:hypothetical protein